MTLSREEQGSRRPAAGQNIRKWYQQRTSFLFDKMCCCSYTGAQVNEEQRVGEMDYREYIHEANQRLFQGCCNGGDFNKSDLNDLSGISNVNSGLTVNMDMHVDVSMSMDECDIYEEHQFFHSDQHVHDSTVHVPPPACALGQGSSPTSVTAAPPSEGGRACAGNTARDLDLLAGGEDSDGSNEIYVDSDDDSAYTVDPTIPSTTTLHLPERAFFRTKATAAKAVPPAKGASSATSSSHVQSLPSWLARPAKSMELLGFISARDKHALQPANSSGTCTTASSTRSWSDNEDLHTIDLQYRPAAPATKPTLCRYGSHQEASIQRIYPHQSVRQLQTDGMAALPVIASGESYTC